MKRKMLRNSGALSTRFGRVAAAFDQAAAKVRLCESSGSEHSAAAEVEEESMADLSDLVNSYLENDIKAGNDDGGDENCGEIELEAAEDESNCGESRTKEEVLENLVSNWENDDVKRNIHAAVAKALRQVGDDGVSSPEFKRRLMSRLRDGGFDAGLCKTKWEKRAKCPSGNFEYVDVNVSGDRYIVEVFLAGEFTIARPTANYTALLECFPHIFVAKLDEFKQVLRVMCSSMKRSMKVGGIHVPPWRRLVYLQAKWFGPYKRTINEISARNRYCLNEELYEKRSVGFAPMTQGLSLYCREEAARKDGTRLVSNLAAALEL